ncbi:MAG: hypothetical protein ACR2KK_16550 [Acidimicrobiales bacterium]
MVLVPENNLGQLTALVRAEFLVDARAITKVQGQRFLFSEIEAAVLALMETDVRRIWHEPSRGAAHDQEGLASDQEVR